ncbi:hypothetical protein WM04_25455 [Burkholderia ubonensis]|nr:hypothetical protein WM04_25455 [Burkholderia ubonensis]OJA27905.1 hypothetical protein BGV47_27680 [Burkholderia ubonensis]OJB26633.1 hypothetical protein BGV55_20285 [Burkholderia ubonensis]
MAAERHGSAGHIITAQRWKGLAREMESTPVHLRGQALVSSECFSGLPTINDMRNVAMLIDGPEALGAAVARIGAQVLAAPMRRIRALDHDGAERLFEALAVVDVSPGDDQ